MSVNYLPRNSPRMTFRQAQQQFAGIEAIDFYLAEQLTQSFLQNPDHQKEQLAEHSELLFVLFMALSESLRQGHSCLPLAIIAKSYWGRASDNDNIITQQGFLFPEQSSLIAIIECLNCEPTDNSKHPVVFWHNSLYLRRYFCFEQELAQAIKPRLSHRSNDDLHAIKACLAQVFTQDDFIKKSAEQLDWQMVSVANALNKKFSIVAGGPGTGKTYTVTKILAAIILLAQQTNNKPINAVPRIAMVAPTGKAAQRLSESINKAVQQFSGQISAQALAAIPKQAQTIHRLLGVIPQSIQFKHHQHNKLAIDVLLIDEVSMVDLALMTRIFRALPDHCQVILLGDADQLPSVMAGSVLTALAPRPHLGYSIENIDYLQTVTQQAALKNKQFLVKKSSLANQNHSDHLTFLQKSHRFDGQGGIGLLAAAVINGDSELSWQLLIDKTSQITRAPLSMTETLTPLVKQYYLPLLQSNELEQAFAQLNKFRVLCVTRQGETGVEAVNEKIIRLLSEHAVIDHEHCYHGQPIMIKENNYQMSLYNGDIGLIWRDSEGHLMAFFENSDDMGNDAENHFTHQPQQNTYRCFMLSQLPPYETVYAMTIHKTQGSEFEHVLMMLPEKSDHRLLSRELLYTGITRAKSQLTLYSKANVWQQGVNKKVQRYDNLAARLFTNDQT